MLKDPAEQLIGKPLVVYIDGERRQIGTITRATIKGDGLFVAASLELGKDDPGEIVGRIFDVVHADA